MDGFHKILEVKVYDLTTSGQTISAPTTFTEKFGGIIYQCTDSSTQTTPINWKMSKIDGTVFMNMPDYQNGLALEGSPGADLFEAKVASGTGKLELVFVA